MLFPHALPWRCGKELRAHQRSPVYVCCGDASCSVRLSGAVCRPVASAYHLRLLRVSALYVPFIYVDRICSRSASNERPHFIPPSGGVAAVSGICPLASPHTKPPLGSVLNAVSWACTSSRWERASS